MANAKPIRRIAIIGTGVIAANWTSLFLAKGPQVVATDNRAIRPIQQDEWRLRARSN